MIVFDDNSANLGFAALNFAKTRNFAFPNRPIISILLHSFGKNAEQGFRQILLICSDGGVAQLVRAAES